VSFADQQLPVASLFPVRGYDLAATLNSGQAFRWRPRDGSWEGVISGHWTRLTQQRGAIRAETVCGFKNSSWLFDYLQLGTDLNSVLAGFPDDEPLRVAVKACRGLRLLRQDPWECLASFILSSTKQIVQIQQIIELLCRRFGQPIPVPAGHPPAYAFPAPQRLAQAGELELRACKMGFRAPYLKATASLVAGGELALPELGALPVEQARASLLSCPGVGPKIADCVLLFAYGF
jgi:N-glycosylase/DNA lyase